MRFRSSHQSLKWARWACQPGAAEKVVGFFLQKKNKRLLSLTNFWTSSEYGLGPYIKHISYITARPMPAENYPEDLFALGFFFKKKKIHRAEHLFQLQNSFSNPVQKLTLPCSKKKLTLPYSKINLLFQRTFSTLLQPRFKIYPFNPVPSS